MRQIATNLPDLPFTNRGDANLESDNHSFPAAAPRAYPRTDLHTLRAWDSFPNDIHAAIQSATTSANLESGAPFYVDALTEPVSVTNEEYIRSYAMWALHMPVRKVLQRLGIQGKFEPPGGGNRAIVGSPDFSWIASTEQPHPKLIAEYKTWWAAGLQDVVPASNGTRHDMLNRSSLHALEQIYGYMTFNNNKFGILTNWKRALFLRRAEVDTLDFYTVELDGNQDISMLKAWVGIILLAEADWFYGSPTLCSAPPNPTFGTTESAIEDARAYKMQPVNGNYECCTLDFRLCQFDLSTARHGQNGCLVETRLILPPIPIIGSNFRTRSAVCKVVDAARYPDAVELLNAEIRAYAALVNLQGKVIPKLYGFYMVWGIIQLIALQPVGQAIGENESISPQLRRKMMKTLRCIHDSGYVHGDVARRNFCRTARDDVFLLDLERCRRAVNQAELLTEMNIVNGW